MRTFLATAALSLAALVGCGDDGSTASVVTPAAASEVLAELADGAVVIDVRTPSEFASGHVEDALNIDVEAEGFAEKVDTLDRATTYVVYCRTGSRAARAIEEMSDLGFDDLVNGGGFEDLVEAGVPTG